MHCFASFFQLFAQVPYLCEAVRSFLSVGLRYRVSANVWTSRENAAHVPSPFM